MSRITKITKPHCFFCYSTRLDDGAQEIEMRTRRDPRPAKVIICARCHKEIFGPQEKENTNAKKER